MGQCPYHFANSGRRYVTNRLWQQLDNLKVAKIGNFWQPKLANIGNFKQPKIANIGNFRQPKIANIGNFRQPKLPILATSVNPKLPILATSGNPKLPILATSGNPKLPFLAIFLLSKSCQHWKCLKLLFVVTLIMSKFPKTATFELHSILLGNHIKWCLKVSKFTKSSVTLYSTS